MKKFTSFNRVQLNVLLTQMGLVIDDMRRLSESLVDDEKITLDMTLFMEGTARLSQMVSTATISEHPRAGDKWEQTAETDMPTSPKKKHKRLEKKCISCGAMRAHRARGNCGSCYQKHSTQVNRGITTWDDLQNNGKVSPAKHERVTVRDAVCTQSVEEVPSIAT